MKIRRTKYGFLLALGGLLLMAAVAGAALYWQGEFAPRATSTAQDGKTWRAATRAAVPPPAPSAAARSLAPPRKTVRNAPAQPWDVAESVGEEGEVVEVVYDEGWQLVGERIRGVRIDGAPPFQVPARKVEDIPMFPCSECHKGDRIDNRKRKLEKEHGDLALTHGGGRFWCDGCHDGAAMDLLSTIDGRLVDMDSAYLLCGQCHFREMNDWQHGVHGKRIGFWVGVRVIRTCTECHNAHRPAIPPFKPDPPPGAPNGKPPSRLHSAHNTKIMRHLADEKEQR